MKSFDVVRRLLGVLGILAVVAVAAVPATIARADEDPHGKLLMVLDSSGSMKEPDASGSTKIGAAKQALNDVVDKLPSDAQVGLRVYGATVFDKSHKGACSDSQLVVPVGQADKPALHKAISKYKPYGETPIAYSLQQAAKDVGSAGKRSILLVSDGEETCNADPCAVAKAIHDKGIDLRIDVVGMSVGGRAEQQLRCIADAGGGDFYNAQDADDLTAQLEQTALRSFRPFTVSGQPVKGALQESAATDVDPGQYTDELGGTKEQTGVKYYRIRPTAGSSIHIAFTSYPPTQPGPVSIGYNDAATLTLKTPDGTECVANTALQMVAGTRQVLVGSISYIPGMVEDDSACASAKELVLVIRRGMGNDSGPAPDTGTIPFEFLVVEEPGLADDGGLPAPVADDAKPVRDTPVDAGSPQGEVAGGGGFAQAATLQPGTWTDSVQGGEVLFYRVRADWGQSPKVTFRVQPSRQAESVLGANPVNAQLSVFGPTRLQVDVGDLTSVVATQTTTLSSALLPVRYRNRELTEDNSSLSDGAPRRSAALAGYYYFVLTMEDSESGKFQLPMQISVAVDGAPSGQPHYKAPPAHQATAKRGGSGSAGTPSDTGAAPASDAKGGSLVPIALGGAGVALVVAIGVVLLAVVRNRGSGRGRDRQGRVPAGYR
ncbi:MAG TPA: VWA domain-containing protein [Actinopolymorphaceae bacterium]|nr:VWA domain-containing protein [Actinopolymorphaceae bacterium]